MQDAVYSSDLGSVTISVDDLMDNRMLYQRAYPVALQDNESMEDPFPSDQSGAAWTYSTEYETHHSPYDPPMFEDRLVRYRPNVNRAANVPTDHDPEEGYLLRIQRNLKNRSLIKTLLRGFGKGFMALLVANGLYGDIMYYQSGTSQNQTTIAAGNVAVVDSYCRENSRRRLISALLDRPHDDFLYKDKRKKVRARYPKGQYIVGPAHATFLPFSARHSEMGFWSDRPPGVPYKAKDLKEIILDQIRVETPIYYKEEDKPWNPDLQTRLNFCSRYGDDRTTPICASLYVNTAESSALIGPESFVYDSNGGKYDVKMDEKGIFISFGKDSITNQPTHVTINTTNGAYIIGADVFIFLYDEMSDDHTVSPPTASTASTASTRSPPPSPPTASSVGMYKGNLYMAVFEQFVGVEAPNLDRKVQQPLCWSTSGFTYTDTLIKNIRHVIEGKQSHNTVFQFLIMDNIEKANPKNEILDYHVRGDPEPRFLWVNLQFKKEGHDVELDETNSYIVDGRDGTDDKRKWVIRSENSRFLKEKVIIEVTKEFDVKKTKTSEATKVTKVRWHIIMMDQSRIQMFTSTPIVGPYGDSRHFVPENATLPAMWLVAPQASPQSAGSMATYIQDIIALNAGTNDPSTILKGTVTNRIRFNIMDKQRQLWVQLRYEKGTNHANLNKGKDESFVVVGVNGEDESRKYQIISVSFPESGEIIIVSRPRSMGKEESTNEFWEHRKDIIGANETTQLYL